jgi:ubiquinone/menaquinone biosynthesis C-methylase UbiE
MISENALRSLINGLRTYKVIAPGYRKRMRTVLSMLDPKKGDSVLEVGCGNGEYTTIMAELGCRVLAMDISRDEVRNSRERVKSRGLSACFVVCDAQRLPLKSGAFGKLFSAEVLEHIPDDKKAVSEISRVMSRSAKGVIDIPMEDPILRDPINAVRRWMGKTTLKRFGGRAWGHYRHYRPRDARAMLEGSGLAVIHEERFFHGLISLCHMYWPEIYTFKIPKNKTKKRDSSRWFQVMGALFDPLTKLSDVIVAVDGKTRIGRPGGVCFEVKKT